MTTEEMQICLSSLTKNIMFALQKFLVHEPVLSRAICVFQSDMNLYKFLHDDDTSERLYINNSGLHKALLLLKEPWKSSWTLPVLKVLHYCSSQFPSTRAYFMQCHDYRFMPYVYWGLVLKANPRNKMFRLGNELYKGSDCSIQVVWLNKEYIVLSKTRFEVD